MAKKQTETKWRPTKKQAAMLTAASEAGLNRTITAVCEEAGVARPTFYRWLDDPHFKREWENAWYGATRRHMPGVVAAQIDAALKGDTAAATFVARMAGLWVDRKEITLPKRPEAMGDDELEEAASALGID